MTQKEKIIKSVIFAQRVKHLAERLRHDAKGYDCSWPISIADELKNASEDVLKKLK